MAIIDANGARGSSAQDYTARIASDIEAGIGPWNGLRTRDSASANGWHCRSVACPAGCCDCAGF